MAINLYAYQKQAVEFHLDAKYSINGYTMGLGKSIISLATIGRAKSLTPLIICPAYLQDNWRNESKKFGCDTPTIASYGKLDKFIDSSCKFDFVVFDEIHYLKNLKAARTQYAFEFIRKQRPSYVLGLSGTPIKNRIPEWYSLLRLMALGNFNVDMRDYKNEWVFSHHFCRAEEFFVRNRRVVKFTGARNTDTLLNLLRPCLITKTQSELPEKIDRFVDIGEVYSKKQSDVLQDAFDKKTPYPTIKAQSALKKVKATLEVVKALIEEGHRPVVFTDHVASAERLAGCMSQTAIKGSLESSKRFALVQDFEKGKSPCLIGTFGAMSTGFNMVSTNHMVFNDLPWVPAELAQAQGRIRRVTQKQSCVYHYVLSGRVDKHIYRTLKTKNKILSEVSCD